MKELPPVWGSYSTIPHNRFYRFCSSIFPHAAIYLDHTICVNERRFVVTNCRETAIHIYFVLLCAQFQERIDSEMGIAFILKSEVRYEIYQKVCLKRLVEIHIILFTPRKQQENQLYFPKPAKCNFFQPIASCKQTTFKVSKITKLYTVPQNSPSFVFFVPVDFLQN